MAKRAAFPRQLSALVSDDMKAFLLGCAELDDVAEAEVVRALVQRGIDGMGAASAVERIAAGRRALAARDEHAEQVRERRRKVFLGPLGEDGRQI